MKRKMIAALSVILSMTLSNAVLAQEVHSKVDHADACLLAIEKQAASLKVALKVSRVDSHANSKSVVCMVTGEKVPLDLPQANPERVVVTLVLQPRDEGYHTVISNL
jgi:hypothetical protein